MGGTYGKLSSGWFQGSKEIRVYMLGLDNAGKTKILYKLNLGKIVTTIPTIGMHVEIAEYKTITFTCWDLGTQKIRPLFRTYYQNAQAVIFVVDSTDRERMDQNVEELQKLMNEDELRDSVLLVLANKQDLPNPMSVAEVTKKLELKAIRKRYWNIQGTCAISGEGLFEGLAWLFQQLKEQQVVYPAEGDPKQKPKGIFGMVKSTFY